MKKTILFTCLIALLAACSRKSAVTAPEETTVQPVNLILDTDLGPDYDDVGAMALMHALADSGQVNILAVVSSNKDEHVVPCIEVLNTYFNRPDIPVGAPKSEGGVSLTTWHKTKWTEELPARYPHKTAKTSDASDAVKVYRRILSTQPDSSVVVCTIGFFTNLKNLLLSGGDEYSPLSGCDLVAKKVKRVVSMAGLFPEAEVVNGTPLIRQARSVKTAIEIEMFRRSGMAHAKAYELISSVYRPGMTDIEFSIEIERLMRLQGCLGIFRVFGRSMEIFMGSVLTGDNAGYPSPYDFALGGRGLDPALPGGADKTPLKEGQSVMVDLGGNFNGYMGDMSRVFSIGKLSEEAYTAHQVCLDIQEKIASIARPGVPCETLYNTAIEMAAQAGFADRFMGTGQQAKFIGHGIGLEINEAPVLAPRIKQELEPGMVFALEPKIVLPGIGPVGIENSWVVTNDGIEKLTNCNEEIVELS